MQAFRFLRPFRVPAAAVLMSALLCFLPFRLPAGAALLLFTLLLQLPLFACLLPASRKWVFGQAGPFRYMGDASLRPCQHLCLTGQTILGPVQPEGTLYLAGGEMDASRLRSVPSFMLLGTALCAALEDSPDPGSLCALLPRLGIDRARLERQFPVTGTVTFRSLTGHTVRDGKAQRAFFLLPAASPGAPAFLDGVSLVQDGAAARPCLPGDRERLASLPGNAFLLFTALSPDFSDLTWLGGLSVTRVHTLAPDVALALETLREEGTSVCLLADPVPQPGALVPPLPLPVMPQAQGLKIGRAEEGGFFPDAVRLAAEWIGARNRLCAFSTLWQLLLCLLFLRLPLPTPAGLLLSVPSVLGIFALKKAGMPVFFPTKHACLSATAFLAADLAICLCLPCAGAWAAAQAVHLFLLALYLQLPLLSLTEHFRRAAGQVLCLTAVLAGPAAWLCLGPEGLFMALLASLCCTLMYLSATRRAKE